MTAPDPRLEEIEARLSKATPGPWEFDGIEINNVPDPEGDTPWKSIMECRVDCMSYCYGGSVAMDIGSDDRALIAHSPTDVAYLLAELRKAQDKLERVEGLVSELAAESLASRNVAREIRKEPITNITRQEIRDHEQSATIATNHATRIWTAVADATGGGK